MAKCHHWLRTTVLDRVLVLDENGGTKVRKIPLFLEPLLASVSHLQTLGFAENCTAHKITEIPGQTSSPSWVESGAAQSWSPFTPKGGYQLLFYRWGNWGLERLSLSPQLYPVGDRLLIEGLPSRPFPFAPLHRAENPGFFSWDSRKTPH